MIYHDISLVSVCGLRGTLYIQRAENGDGVSVQAEGPYEAKAVADSWPGTKFELVRCDGMRKGPRGWHFMRGKDRFRILIVSRPEDA
jgi:hypothetical protein